MNSYIYPGKAPEALTIHLANAREACEYLVSETVRLQDPTRAVNLMLALIKEVGEENQDFAVANLYAVLTAWLHRASKTIFTEEEDLRPVMDWVFLNLGNEAAGFAEQAACYLFNGTEISLEDETSQALGSMLVPSLVWLVAGLVGTFGNGDAFWVRQFDHSLLSQTINAE